MKIKTDIYANGPELDTVVRTEEGETVAVSYYDRNLRDVTGFGSEFLQMAERNRGCWQFPLWIDRRKLQMRGTDYRVSWVKRDAGKDVFYHGMILSRELGRNIFACTDETEQRVVYDYLMENFPYRILPEWSAEIMNGMIRENLLLRGSFVYQHGDHSRAGREMFGGMHYLSFLKPSEKRMAGLLSSLLRAGRISIPGADSGQEPLGITGLDEYLERQGGSLAGNLGGMLSSYVGLDDPVENVAFRDFSLYRQQALMVNGAVKMLSGKKKSGKSRYCFLSMDMGTGKTCVAAAIADKYANDRYLRTHPGKTFADVLRDGTAVNYRVIVLCPGHLLEKWKREVESRIAWSRATVISDFSQLLWLREHPRPEGREFWIISKDFAKLDYMEQPVPSRMRHMAVGEKTCSSCHRRYRRAGDTCPECGARGFTVETGEHFTLYEATGLTCPDCGRVLLPYQTLTDAGVQLRKALTAEDFARPGSLNRKCYWCNGSLWQPYVRSLELPWFADDGGSGRRAPAWKRITVVRNAGTGKTETMWAHRRYQRDLIASAVNVRADNGGCRKVAPGRFIKKYLHFDFLIADEAHEYRGASAQGEVFSALCGVSDRVLALTGTITGGKAHDLFYLLYRLDPARMRGEGFGYRDALRFSYAYGTVAKETRYADDGVTVREGTPRVEPGISPLVYPRFLHDRQVALNLTDMSASLPELRERVISVRPDEEEEAVMAAYREVIDTLTERSRGEGMTGLLPRMLQFSLSYPDHPYTDVQKEIFDPYGEPVCGIPQFDAFRDPGHLSSKEKALVRDVREQLAEGRNCVVYCEYTASPDTCVTERLREILARETGARVGVLKASSPPPAEREAYMRRLSEEGTRVWITNPRCTETGLDFVWETDGVRYNFPTIINFQLGYSLPVVQQSTRRHYRLIQTERCETHYIVWEDTIETAVLRVIARKQMAHSSVQGRFSAEGLSAMTGGTCDVRKEIFSELMRRDTTHGADIQGMFDAIAGARGGCRGGTERMPTVRDVIGDADYERLFGTHGLTLEDVTGTEDLSGVGFDGFELF